VTGAVDTFGAATTTSPERLVAQELGIAFTRDMPASPRLTHSRQPN